MEGRIFNIQRFCVNDGPGIRTTVFLKGCPLKCLWCHNPESLSKKEEVFFLKEKCAHCFACQRVCQKGCHAFEEENHRYLRSGCVLCKNCIEACPYGALEAVGYKRETEEVLKEVLKDKVFYETSQGGLTISGGEPLYQFEFTLELLQRAKKEGLHTCIETSGFGKKENLLELGKFTDIFLYDFKESNPEKHKEFTGVDNKIILENLRALDKGGSKIILRCPIIPTCNDREDHFEQIALLANSLSNIIEINIEPYHPLGQGKTENLGKEYPLKGLTFPKEETISLWEQTIQSLTKVPVKRA